MEGSADVTLNRVASVANVGALHYCRATAPAPRPFPSPACLVNAKRQKYISQQNSRKVVLTYAAGQEGTCR